MKRRLTSKGVYVPKMRMSSHELDLALGVFDPLCKNYTSIGRCGETCQPRGDTCCYFCDLGCQNPCRLFKDREEYYDPSGRG